MIALAEHLTSTRKIGIAAYSVALVCCSVVWARSRCAQHSDRTAAWLTTVEGTLLLDMIFNWRWMLHDLFVGFAHRGHEYDLRRPVQVVILSCLGGMFLVGLYRIRRHYRLRAGAFVAVSGVLLSLACWATEVVSLHQMDALLYRPIWSFMVVCFVWGFACLATSVGILLDWRQLHVIATSPSLNSRRIFDS